VFVVRNTEMKTRRDRLFTHFRHFQPPEVGWCIERAQARMAGSWRAWRSDPSYTKVSLPMLTSDLDNISRLKLDLFQTAETYSRTGYVECMGQFV
jgi:hypothetical protein